MPVGHFRIFAIRLKNVSRTARRAGDRSLRQSLMASLPDAERNCRKSHSRFMVSQKSYTIQRNLLTIVSLFYYIIHVLTNKAKGQRNSRETELLALAFVLLAGWQSGLMLPTPNRVTVLRTRPVGSNPTPAARLNSPTCSANCSWGLASGLLQRQDCLDPLSFWTQLLEESKAQSDLSQLPDRMPEVR
ncbi:MAG: hypothetical protein JWO19_4326 [Bryobacterales bacterium]|jgi:hypothetical protein|nr:hypothetical protein [Bryobacterales bacterium]